MSLGINTSTPEGIVLAADSRQSYRNRKGVSRIGSDSASKVFKLGKKCGLIVTGLAFLPDSEDNNIPKNISRFIEDFCRQTQIETLTVEEVGNKLHYFFNKRYQYQDQLKNLPNQIKADLERKGCEVLDIKETEDHVRFRFKDSKGVENEGIAAVEQLQFIIAGYNNDNSHQACTIHIPGNTEMNRNSKGKEGEYGASWVGQTDVVTRIILGFDGRISSLPIIQKIGQEIGTGEVQKQLRALEYAIQWGTMTLQDGIDFSKLAIETTIAIQRFSDGIHADPGDIPGVGGSIDVAVITKDKGFVWVSKKNLRFDGREVNLEDLPNS